MWIAGPLSGTLVQPYVGIKSDRCRSKWGKRRPFIIGGAICTIASLVCLAWTRELVGNSLALFGVDREAQATKTTSIVVAVLFVYILDFSINTSKSTFYLSLQAHAYSPKQFKQELEPLLLIMPPLINRTMRMRGPLDFLVLVTSWAIYPVMLTYLDICLSLETRNSKSCVSWPLSLSLLQSPFRVLQSARGILDSKAIRQSRRRVSSPSSLHYTSRSAVSHRRLTKSAKSSSSLG